MPTSLQRISDSNKSFEALLESKGKVTMEQSEEMVMKSLMNLEGTELTPSGKLIGQAKLEGERVRVFEEGDWTLFYGVIHDMLYKGGYNYRLICNIIGRLWQHDIDNHIALIAKCRENYYFVKKHIFWKGQAIFESVQEWNLSQYNNQFEVVTIKKGSRKIKITNVDPDLALIKNFARKHLSIPIANFDLCYKIDEGVRRKVKGDSDFTGLESPLELIVHMTQIGFSDVPTLQKALDMCGEKTTHKENCQLEDLMSEDEANEIMSFPKYKEELEHAHSTIERLQSVLSLNTGGEQTKRSYILPVAVAAALISGEVRIQEEKRIESPFAHGPVDYTFIYNDAIICVTEAKDGDMKKGLMQNIAQLAATRNERKRKFDYMLESGYTYYGIATSYRSWQLIELDGNQVTSSVEFGPGVPGDDWKNSVAEVIKHLVNVLKKSKSQYDQTQG